MHATPAVSWACCLTRILEAIRDRHRDRTVHRHFVKSENTKTNKQTESPTPSYLNLCSSPDRLGTGRSKRFCSLSIHLVTQVIIGTQRTASIHRTRSRPDHQPYRARSADATPRGEATPAAGRGGAPVGVAPSLRRGPSPPGGGAVAPPGGEQRQQEEGCTNRCPRVISTTPPRGLNRTFF